MTGGAGRGRLVGQGAVEVRRLGRRRSFGAAGFRAVPGCIVRRSAYIAPGVVLMPSFVNLGAYVDEGTMVDTWATVGSCAQIGKNCHISGGAGIGGVLEPLQAGPVIIEDNCFIGARAEVAEGVIVGEGSVLSMGVYLGASTKIVDRATGEVLPGRGAALFGGRVGHAAGQADAERRGRPEPLLRRHRQARRREDPRQDLHQRTAARLKCARDVALTRRDQLFLLRVTGRTGSGHGICTSRSGTVQIGIAALFFAAINFVMAVLDDVTDQGVVLQALSGMLGIVILVSSSRRRQALHDRLSPAGICCCSIVVPRPGRVGVLSARSWKLLLLATHAGICVCRWPLTLHEPARHRRLRSGWTRPRSPGLHRGGAFADLTAN